MSRAGWACRTSPTWPALGVTVAGRAAAAPALPFPAGLQRLRARPCRAAGRELRGARRRPAGRALGARRRAARASHRQPLGRVPQPGAGGRGGLDRPLRRAVRATTAWPPAATTAASPTRTARSRRRTAISSARIEDALLLRGSRDFDTVADYRALRRRAGRPPQRPQPQAHRRRARRAAAAAEPARRGRRGDDGHGDLVRRLHAPPGLLHRALAPHRPPAAGAPPRRSARGLPRRHASDDAAARSRLRRPPPRPCRRLSPRHPRAAGPSPGRCPASSTATSSSRATPIAGSTTPPWRPCRRGPPASSSSARWRIAHERGCEADLAALIDAQPRRRRLPGPRRAARPLRARPRGAAAGHGHADPAQRLRRLTAAPAEGAPA